MSRAATASRGGNWERLAPPGYFDRSTRPLPSLLLLAPLIIVYEVGTRYFTTAAMHGADQQVIAFSKMQQFFHLFGATGRHLPALAVVASLLCWHIVRNDTWQVSFGTVAGMGVESALLSLPLFLIGILLARYYPLAAATKASSLSLSGPTRDMFIMSLGAGVYEEFVFRLAAFALFSAIFRDFLRMHQLAAGLLMVFVSAGLFALYHYWDTSEPFVGKIFTFRTAAGVYFGVIFLLRGFGVTAAAHSIYDIIFTAALLS